MPTDNEFTRILQWPGYCVYQHKIDEKGKTLDLWVRRKRGNRKLECSGCGRKFEDVYDCNERAVRDLPWSEFNTTVHIEVYRVKCPHCGVRIEKVPLLPSKAPFSKRFEDAVGQACESASARQVARRFGRERKKETLDEFFEKQLSVRQRHGIEAACVDMWEAYRLSIEQWAPQCRIVYDKFHVMQHANKAIDEVRRAEFFRKGGRMRGLVKGKRWLLLSRWMNLTADKRQELNQLFALNRKVFKAYLLKESLDRLWTYRYEGAMLNYLQRWIDQLRWQRLEPFRKLAVMLLDHLDGILNYCRTKVPLGVVEAVNGDIKSLLRRGRGYKNLRYLLLKAQRMAATKTEFVVFKKAA